MKSFQSMASAGLYVWAGVSLAGNLVASPAKFQVASLTTAELLQVGRAQFEWIGNLEYVLLSVVLASLCFARRQPHWTLLTAIVVFLLQQLQLQPLLQERSDIIIAGAQVPGNGLHIVFVVAELIKWSLLLVAAQYVSAPQSHVSAPLGKSFAKGAI